MFNGANLQVDSEPTSQNFNVVSTQMGTIPHPQEYWSECLATLISKKEELLHNAYKQCQKEEITEITNLLTKVLISPETNQQAERKNNRRFKKPAVSTGTLQTVVINLSKKMLDEHHHSLLSKGLSFCQDYTPYQPTLPHVKRYLPVQPSS